MRHSILLASIFAIALAAGCGDGGTSSGGGGGGTTTTTSSNSTGGGGAGGSSTGGGGASTGGGGAGGSSTGGGGSSAGGGGGGTTTTTTEPTPVADHLLISEISVAPEGGEFIEIWNPTGADVSLGNYYLSDNSTYVDIASGKPWAPITNNPGTDFLARFPANAVLPAGQVRVIAFDPGFQAQYGKCPDFFMGTAALPCGGADVPALLATENGSIADTSNLSNSREMVMLFTWSGDTADLLQDVDYVTWGDTFEDGSRADKTAVTGYKPDTAPPLQKGAAVPEPTQSIERCDIEPGETETGGNGLGGHDETSEDLAASFVVTAMPTPGVKNACLP